MALSRVVLGIITAINQTRLMVNSKAEKNMMIMMNSLKNDEGDADEEE